MAKTGRRYPLLIYTHMIDRWWPAILLLGLALASLAWPLYQDPFMRLAEPWRWQIMAGLGGAVTLIGNVSPTIELGLQPAVTRQIRLQGSCASSGEYPACISMISRGAICVEPLISAVAPLEDGASWFTRLYDREPGLLKVVLEP